MRFQYTENHCVRLKTTFQKCSSSLVEIYDAKFSPLSSIKTQRFTATLGTLSRLGRNCHPNVPSEAQITLIQGRLNLPGGQCYDASEHFFVQTEVVVSITCI